MRVVFLLLLFCFTSSAVAQTLEEISAAQSALRKQFIQYGVHYPFSTKINGVGVHFEIGNRFQFPVGKDHFLINAAWMGINANLVFEPQANLGIIEVQPLKLGPGYQALLSEKVDLVMVYQVMPTFGMNSGIEFANSNYWALFHGPLIGVQTRKFSIGAEGQFGQMNFFDKTNLYRSDTFIAYARLVFWKYF